MKLFQLSKRYKLDGLNELYQFLQTSNDSDIMHELIGVATTNHTYFFREETVCNFFKTKIIPSLPVNSQVRIWSCASASGEEAYSFAIFLKELYKGSMQNINILGTDIDTEVVKKAELGTYSLASVKSIPDATREKYFTENT